MRQLNEIFKNTLHLVFFTGFIIGTLKSGKFLRIIMNRDLSFMLKVLSFLILIFYLNVSWANISQSDFISIYVIKPKYRLSWDSPSRLLIKTALNSIRDDYAPIGHFAVELNCSPEPHGPAQHVLTGMERIDAKKSKKIVLKERLGLGSLFYSFEGNLVPSDQTKKEIEQARKDKRLKKITVPVSSQNCSRALEFLDKWIQSGSYTVYGGEKNTLQGEGAGCADFASVLFNLSSGYYLPEDWIVRRKIPKKFIGDDENKISFLKLLLRQNWTKKDEDFMDYETADANLAFDWIKKRSGEDEEYFYPLKLIGIELVPFEFMPIDFFYNYRTTHDPEVIWDSIKLLNI